MNSYENKKLNSQHNKHKQSEKKTSSSRGNASNKSEHKGTKRPIQQITLDKMGFSKKEVESKDQPQIQYYIKHILKGIELTTILNQVPKLTELCRVLSSIYPVNPTLITQCLSKYFLYKKQTLWCQKYVPASIEEIYPKQFSKKIQEWIKDFYLYRKDLHEDDDFQFCDERIEDSFSKSIQDRMRMYGWNCRALILRGRSGVGKVSFLKAIAKSLKINSFEYGSHLDQLSMMKERSGLTESNCVNNLSKEKKQYPPQNKLLDKLKKQNNSIVQFLPAQQEVNSTANTFQVKQAKRLQIFRNFHMYFPANNYFRYLTESIQSTTIPYALTTNKEQVQIKERKIHDMVNNKFDIVEFVEASVDQMTDFYWVVYMIEKFLGGLDLWVKSTTSSVFDELNKQLHNIQFTHFIDRRVIRRVICQANQKHYSISNFLQFTLIRIDQKEQPGSQVYTLRNNLELERKLFQFQYQMMQSFNEQRIVYDIKWDVYYEQHNHQTSLPEQTETMEHEKQISKNTLTTIQKDEKSTENGMKSKIRQLRQMLQIEAIQDNRLLKSEYSKGISKEERFEIDSELHVRTKRKLLRGIKSKGRKEGRSIALKAVELAYLPLLFTSRRTSRNSRKHTQLTLRTNLLKLLTKNELDYLWRHQKWVNIY